MHDFQDLNAVINYVKEAIVIDLMDHVMAIDEDPYLIALNEPPEGIYLAGSIEPIIEKGKMYYPKALYPNPRSKITDFSKIRDLKDDVVNADGEIVLRYKDYVTKPRFFKTEPTVPSVALRAAVSVVEQYLISAASHSKRSHPRYRLEYLVKPEFQNLVIEDKYILAFKNLLEKVKTFVGEDTWHMYFTKVKGTSLIIEKGIDFRIYRYYEDEFKALELAEE